MRTIEAMQAAMRLATLDALDASDTIEQAATLLLAAAYNLLAAKHGHEQAGRWLMTQALHAPKPPEDAQGLH